MPKYLVFLCVAMLQKYIQKVYTVNREIFATKNFCSCLGLRKLKTRNIFNTRNKY